MMASQKQIDANRRNAQKSTGPRTEEGKGRTRRNALTHGLSARVVLPEDQARAVEARTAEFESELKPEGAFERWLLGIIAVETVRLDRCRLHEIALRAEQAVRAGESWNEDRRLAAEELGAAKGRQAAWSRARLHATLQGSQLLLSWWEALGRALEGGGWTPGQEALALELLGVPAALLDGEANPLTPGPGVDHLDHRRAIVAGELDRLRHLIAEVLPARDERERADAARGLAAEDSPPLVLLHRYETASLRRLQWAQRQLRSLSREVRPADRAEGRPPLAAPEVRSDEAIPAAEVQPPIPVATLPAGEPARRGRPATVASLPTRAIPSSFFESLDVTAPWHVGPDPFDLLRDRTAFREAAVPFSISTPASIRRAAL